MKVASTVPFRTSGRWKVSAVDAWSITHSQLTRKLQSRETITRLPEVFITLFWASICKHNFDKWVITPLFLWPKGSQSVESQPHRMPVPHLLEWGRADPRWQTTAACWWRESTVGEQAAVVRKHEYFYLFVCLSVHRKIIQLELNTPTIIINLFSNRWTFECVLSLSLAMSQWICSQLISN